LAGGTNEQRPCPFVGCHYHTFLTVKPSGSIKLNYAGREPWELSRSCSLDVAERGGVTLQEAGHALNLTRQRIQQIERDAKAKLVAHGCSDLREAAP
jgi:hypothetical protein